MSYIWHRFFIFSIPFHGYLFGTEYMDKHIFHPKMSFTSGIFYPLFFLIFNFHSENSSRCDPEKSSPPTLLSTPGWHLNFLCVMNSINIFTWSGSNWEWGTKKKNWMKRWQQAGEENYEYFQQIDSNGG